MPRARRAALLVLPLSSLVLMAALVSSPHNPVGYVARAAASQARLLWGRVPADGPLPSLDAGRREKLALVQPILVFAEQELGLRARGAYRTIHPDWDTPVWNVSACPPLSFEPRRYWFPFVGSVPYVGFFDEPSARERARRLEAEGYETWVRTAGTYSTLGWFDDPLLPAMLDWSEHRLADTLVHELVHANVWVRGSAEFNESLANFVGQHGALRWFALQYGDGSPPHVQALATQADEDRWRRLLAQVVRELDLVFTDSGSSDAERLARKTAIRMSLPARVDAAGFHEPARYRTAAEPGSWNNARLVQYRTYNRGYSGLEALFDAVDRDLPRFLDQIRVLARDGGDPFAALAAASGVPDGDVSEF